MKRVSDRFDLATATSYAKTKGMLISVHNEYMKALGYLCGYEGKNPVETESDYYNTGWLEGSEDKAAK